MNRKVCRLTRQEIDQSELGERLSEQALKHIASCPACGEFRTERARLRELVGSLMPVAAPQDFDVRLRARITAERQSPPRSSFFARFAVSTPAVVVAAVLVMLVGSIVWYAQLKRNQATSASNAPMTNTGASTAGGLEVAKNDGAVNKNPGTIQSPPIPDVVKTNGGNREGNSPRRTPAIAQSTDYGVYQTESIKQLEQRPGEVSLSAPGKPLVVSVEDDHGTTRKILLPPVSFGAQRLVDNRVPVSTTNSRSW